jgi:glycosyltransferase involved in cell wall biosynthesis
VCLIDQPNSGIVAALNNGVQAASAPLVAIMHSDDVAIPRRLEVQARYLHEHPECVAVGSRIMTMSEDGLELNEQFLLTEHDAIDRRQLAGHGEMAHPSVMFRRAAAIEAGLYRQGFAIIEDIDLWLRLAERGKLANVPEVLLKYRLRPSSIFHSGHDRFAGVASRMIADAYARRKLPGPPPAFPQIPPAGHPSHTLGLWARLAQQGRHYTNAIRLAHRAVKAGPIEIRNWATLLISLSGPLGGAALRYRFARRVRTGKAV